MTLQINRRKFLQRVGQAGGGFVAACGMQSLLTSCAGNVSATAPATTTSSAPAAAPKIASAGLKTAGLLQWGADMTDGAPYVFKDPTNPTKLIGFEVEIADAIAKLMNISEQQAQTDYEQLAASLLSNQFDMVMNGWEIEPDREKTELFSEPYYRYGQQIVTRVGDSRFSSFNADSTLSLTNLHGMKVGTGSGYKAEDILKSDAHIITKSYDGNLPFDDLKQKKIDAMLIDQPIAAYYVMGSSPGGTKDTALQLVGKPIYENNYVIGFNKSNPHAQTLLSEINQALDTLKKDGTLKGIYQHWQMWNDQQGTIGIT